MQSETLKKLSLSIMFISFVAFVYLTVKAMEIVDKTQIGTSKGTYTSYVTRSEDISEKAKSLTLHCQNKVCKVQSLLDFASNIPYQTHTFQRKSPQATIQENFGDCDDKSNLLISLLHSLEIEAYFVLVPKHIFVIVPLDEKQLSKTKGLWVNGRKYYILESTAKDSILGYPLHYSLSEIDTIIEPFTNKKIDIDSLKYE